MNIRQLIDEEIDKLEEDELLELYEIVKKIFTSKNKQQFTVQFDANTN